MVVKMVWLAEISELPLLPGGENRIWARPKTSIIDPSNTRVVVSELGLDFGLCDERGDGFWVNGVVCFGVRIMVEVVI